MADRRPPPCVHITIEADVPVDLLERFLVALRDVDEEDRIAIVAFFRRGKVSRAELKRIHEKVFGDLAMPVLDKRDDVQRLKDIARGNRPKTKGNA